MQLLGGDRVDYPENHITVDNRLSWFLGRLNNKFADDAYYVHLKRNRRDVAKSRYNDWLVGMMAAYSQGILEHGQPTPGDELAVCFDYVDCITENIEHFLKDKTKKQTIWIEEAETDFQVFWDAIKAEGDLGAALNEFSLKHGETKIRRDVDATSFDIQFRKEYYGV